MKLALWNIDHPEANTNNKKKTKRYEEIYSFLKQQNCEVFIICEANSPVNNSPSMNQ